MRTNGIKRIQGETERYISSIIDPHRDAADDSYPFAGR